MRANSLRTLRTVARCCRVPALVPRTSKFGVRWLSSDREERQWSTPLAKMLGEAITTTGPISVAAYMRQCLTAPEGGYYTRQTTDGDQFGAKGDFITSPEISQVFGEMVGLWLYTEWLAQGKKDKVQIIEVGPGRGTLMDDVLRTISNFKSFGRSIEAIYLVEASPHLRKQQAKLLCGTEELKQVDIGESAPCKYLPSCDVNWCEDIRLIPKEATSTPLILAHEFFDALPIHIFQNVAGSNIPASSTIMTPTGPIKPKHGPQAPKNQWHELVVSPTPPPDLPFQSEPEKTHTSTANPPPPDFELTISKSPTPHSLYLPQTSPRYKALATTPDAIIEISPESLSYISDFAVRIGGPNTTDTEGKPHTPSGAALILDYGPLATIPANTLRGIRHHAPCSPFITPGLVDLSADVDFLGLAEGAIKASPSVEVHGPVEQAFFLNTMGIKERAERLIKAAGQGSGDAEGKDEDETVKRLETGWKRLVDRGPTGMGRIYKAMAIVPYVPGKGARRPVGFGGDVVA
ncbi:DUF185-domain-containing protein [Amniculicola lignicola CBS 123094]|uniref:Protein arginine methyltransferase NDUFAF7 n=1 Tax=Amniculicola lignicola CBS 123094 TaxID=1392246 RepID=A0A6A5WFD2_9PLEO|nr:DUF185-domain-containing protein [Amniculicola lignicola CBS 123094]